MINEIKMNFGLSFFIEYITSAKIIKKRAQYAICTYIPDTLPFLI
jgi:hypothetical protein